MKRFADLLDRLSYSPSRNAKLRLMAEYFHTTPDPDRGWALAALTEGLSFPAVKASTIRNLMTERVDPNIIGGVVATVGGTVFDGSVTTQLEHMRRRLTS